MDLSTNEDKQTGDCCQKCRIQRVIDNVEQMKKITNGNGFRFFFFNHLFRMSVLERKFKERKSEIDYRKHGNCIAAIINIKVNIFQYNKIIPV